MKKPLISCAASIALACTTLAGPNLAGPALVGPALVGPALAGPIQTAAGVPAVSALQAAAQEAEDGEAQDAEKSGESTHFGGVKFDLLSFDNARSRAERTEKFLVIFWGGGATAKEDAFGERVFNDKSVQRWLAENAVAVHINAVTRKKDARKNGLSTDLLPTVDILDIQRGGRIERLRGDATATHFLAAVLGTVDAKRPTGESVNEPFGWLAWANARFRDGSDLSSGEKAVQGYDWCLLNADRYRPGFRAKYFEFLLQRIASCKQRSQNAVETLFRERRRLAALMSRGIATESDVYELTRVDFWLRKELLTRDLYVDLRHKGENQTQARRWLFPTVVPVLGRFEQYDEILDVVAGDANGMFQARITAIAAPASETAPKVEADPTTAKGDAEALPKAEPITQPSAQPIPAPKPESEMTALDFALADSRADIIEDASWVYEALLIHGRGKDAKDLMTLITTTYPVNKAFGLFVERALRAQIWSAAAETADIAMSVLDERGQRRMQRLMKRIPKDVSAPSGGKSTDDK